MAKKRRKVWVLCNYARCDRRDVCGHSAVHKPFNECRKMRCSSHQVTCKPTAEPWKVRYHLNKVNALQMKIAWHWARINAALGER
jgi:hypothetical protein